MKKNILLLFGGGSTEHEISIVSSKYIKSTLDKLNQYSVVPVLIDKDNVWKMDNGNPCELDFSRNIVSSGSKIKIDAAIPCIHGWPGETGDIQSYFEMIKLPYLGCNSESSKICFNKMTTKLWLTQLGIKNTPFLNINSTDEMSAAEEFIKKYKKVVVKATNQGSSVGCYITESKTELATIIKDAFNYSPFVIVEKHVTARELEVSVYQIGKKTFVSKPGEIICPSGFYSYDEKYSSESKTYTETVAKNLTDKVCAQIMEMSRAGFSGLKLRHLSRFDFFYSEKTSELYLNEINTFPGLTPISMFPKMMIENGHSFESFLDINLNEIMAL